MSAFHKVANSVIAVNTGLLVAAAIHVGYEELLDHIEVACWSFFWLELGLRAKEEGRAFFRRPSTWADLLIMAVSAPMLGSAFSALRIARLARLARLVHVGRHLSGLRAWRLVVPAMARLHWRWYAPGVPLVIEEVR